MEAIAKQRTEAPREIFSPVSFPQSFLHRRWWNRSMQQETLTEVLLALVTFSMVGAMLWGFFRALNEWQLGG